jgi:hypothetical protein
MKIGKKLFLYKRINQLIFDSPAYSIRKKGFSITLFFIEIEFTQDFKYAPMKRR